MPVPMMAPMPSITRSMRRQRALEAVGVLGIGAELVDGLGGEERIGHQRLRGFRRARMSSALHEPARSMASAV